MLKSHPKQQRGVTNNIQVSYYYGKYYFKLLK